MTADDQTPVRPPLSGEPSLFAPSWQPAPDVAAAAAAVVVEFQLTEDDVVSGLRRQLPKTGRIKVLVIGGVLLLLLGAFASAALDGLGALLITLGVFYLAFAAWIVLVGPRRAWRRNPVLHGPQYIAFSADGIYAHSTVAESRQQWRVYASMMETDRCYVLRLASRKAYAFVPKRAFKSPTDEAEFRRLASLHMRVEGQPAPA